MPELLIIALILMAILLMFVTAKWLLLRREVAGITRSIRRIHGRFTNERITVSTQDRSVGELANAVNTLYEDVYRERGEHRDAMDQLRQSMANISHDLRTPLTSILGYVKLLRAEGDERGQAERYLDIIQRKASSLASLVSGLFELARLEANAYQFELERVDAAELLSEELAGFYDALTAGDNEPVIQLESDGLWIVGDRSALSRVFSNLLSNVVKYGASDVKITGEKRDKNVILTFSNRADGLSRADADQLFQRFFTADRMRTGESTGLGLSIVKEFVEQMDGTIAASLEEGILTFTLTWTRIKQ